MKTKAEIQKKYRLSHPEYKRKWSTTGIKHQIKERLGNQCFICGFDRLTHLHHKYKKKHKKDYAIKRTNDYLLLCPNHHDLLHADLLTEKEITKLKQYYTTTEFYINFSKNLKTMQKCSIPISI